VDGRLKLLIPRSRRSGLFLAKPERSKMGPIRLLLPIVIASSAVVITRQDAAPRAAPAARVARPQPEPPGAVVTILPIDPGPSRRQGGRASPRKRLRHAGPHRRK
jgi:hypothetical protein